MAYIQVDGYEIPIVFPVGEGSRALVCSHLLHVRFKFVESSLYVEEEKMSVSSSLLQSITVEKSDDDCWYLLPRNYRAYGLPLALLPASTEILSCQSNTSTVNMPYNTPPISHHV